MTNESKLWQIKYKYHANCLDGEGYVNNFSYFVIADNEAEALSKGDQCFKGDNSFSSSGLHKNLLIDTEAIFHLDGTRLYNLQRTASQYSRNISAPKLTLDSDSEQFDLQPKIGSDGKTLEFIVNKK